MSANPDPKREKELFESALGLASPAERAAYIKGACGDNSILRQRIEALLAAHEGQSKFLQDNSANADAASTLVVEVKPTEVPGAVIGRYKLLEKIGEGGFGSVWAAEQREPVKRRVALKIIKLGMDTKQVVARFEAERQALALMDHPNIAKVLDAGTTDNGRPFFVMELVKGIPVTKYCDQEQLSTQDRLDLFIKVCQAIQHAHQKGIIHRDIKPSNILVTLHDGVPVPKVIDFGIAKATQQELTELTIYTQHHQFIGTPAYMSPEQAEMSGLDIDTRSDIYSLGVLLYELLTGSTPFNPKELMQSGIDEMRRIIREQEPVRPSTKLSQTLAVAPVPVRSAKHASRHASHSAIESDLDWIVMKCLEKDRARRYETANGLAADLKRHLSNEPVVARPPSAAYKFQKAWRRNKVLYTAGIAVAAALAIGLMTSVRQMMIAKRAEHDKSEALLAEQEQRNAAQASQKEAEVARRQAEAQVLETRRRSYAADINLAQNNLEGGNLGRALELLNSQVPEAGNVDLRGWEWRYLHEQCQSEAIRTLCVLTNSSIQALSASSDGRWLAIMAGSTRMILWDLVRGAIAETFETAWFPRSMAFSPSSSLLGVEWQADATKDLRGVRIWDLRSRQVVADFATGDQRLVAIAFSRDEKRLMSVSWEGVVKCWQIPEGLEIPLPWNEGTFSRLTPGPSAQIYGDIELVAKGDYRGFRVLDARAGRELWSTNTTSDGWVSQLAFSPERRLLASTGRRFMDPISLWEATTGRLITNLVGHQSRPFDLMFGPEGKWLASASADHSIRIWDLQKLPQIPSARVLKGHKQEVWALALLNDGRTLVSGAKDGEVCLWDMTSSGRPTNHFAMSMDKHSAFPGFSADRHPITLLDCQRGELREWDGRQTASPRQLTGWDSSSRRTRWSREGRRLATSGTNAFVQVWDARKLMLITQIPTISSNPAVLQFDKRGERLAILDRHDLLTWDVDGNRRMTSRALPERRESSGDFRPEVLVLSSDFSWAVLHDAEKAHDERGELFSIMDLSTGKMRTLGAMYGVNDVEVSPNDELVAIASVDGFVRVWRTDTCREVATLRGFRNVVVSAAFSHDGARLAVGTGGDGLISIWDVATWRELITLKSGSEWVTRLQFTPDGSSLWAAVQTADTTFHLWRVPSWDEVAPAEAKVPMSAKQP